MNGDAEWHGAVSRLPMPNGGMGLIPDTMDCRDIRAAGHQLWLYNGWGFDRFSFGYFLWRTGAHRAIRMAFRRAHLQPDLQPV